MQGISVVSMEIASARTIFPGMPSNDLQLTAKETKR